MFHCSARIVIGCLAVLGLAAGSTYSPRESTVHAAPAADIVSAASPSGQAMPVGDLPGWHQIFTDDFTTPAPLGSFPGTAYGTTWYVRKDGSSDTSGHGRYYPSKVLSVTNGVLNMYLHTENGVHMVSAPAPILPGHAPQAGQLYGRYAVRFRADSLYGYKTSWLLWPDNGNWPYDGEIDFPEGDLNKTIHGYMHHMYGTSPSDQDWFLTSTSYSSWHTAVTEWTPGKLTFYLDGQVIGTSTTRVPSTPMHWTLQTETALDGSVPSNSTAGNVQVDWVTAYSYTGTSSSNPSVNIGCTSGSANPSNAHASWTEYLGANVTSTLPVSGAIVSFEVYNAAGSRVYQSASAPLVMLANQAAWATSSWKIPSTQSKGTYTVKVLVYGPSWTPLFTSSWACTSFSVS